MRRSILLCLALVALPACPGSLEDPGRFAGQFGGGGAGGCPDVPVFFQTTCAGASCHNATSPANMLDLASPDVAARLSNKMATGGPGLLIDPAHPEASVLYTKLTASPPFGSRMPLTGGPLDDTTVECVLTWIQTSTKGSP